LLIGSRNTSVSQLWIRRRREMKKNKGAQRGRPGGERTVRLYAALDCLASFRTAMVQASAVSFRVLSVK
jgi:hypothetical protein